MKGTNLNVRTPSTSCPLPTAVPLLRSGGQMVILIKPQFE